MVYPFKYIAIRTRSVENQKKRQHKKSMATSKKENNFRKRDSVATKG